jgi:hypothetical protein
MMRLEERDLGVLSLDCDSGYVVVGFDIGSPVVREVETPRALADGVDDHSFYVGARAVSVAVRCDQRVADLQTLLDRLTPYVSPRRRPQLIWSVPSSSQERSLVLSGRNVSRAITGPRYQTVVMQWKAPSGVIQSPERACIEIYPRTDVELGRVYSENYADGGRGPYPASLGRGERVVINLGNERADIVATIYGPAVDPSLRVNGATMQFTGLTLLEGETVVIRTEFRTIWLNGEPGQSRYHLTNYRQWTWDQFRLQADRNLVRVGAASGDPALLLCYHHTYTA